MKSFRDFIFEQIGRKRIIMLGGMVQVNQLILNI